MGSRIRTEFFVECLWIFVYLWGRRETDPIHWLTPLGVSGCKTLGPAASGAGISTQSLLCGCQEGISWICHLLLHRICISKRLQYSDQVFCYVVLSVLIGIELLYQMPAFVFVFFFFIFIVSFF